MVGIDGKLDSKVLPEAKGNGSPPLIDDDWVRFLWPGCTNHLGRALGQHVEASDELNQRGKDMTGARFSQSARKTRERERERGEV
jgi:hypothetical protein